MDFASRTSLILLYRCALLPSIAGAWGANAHRLITNKAMDILPPELRGFYEANRVAITAMVTDPIESARKKSKRRSLPRSLSQPILAISL